MNYKNLILQYPNFYSLILEIAKIFKPYTKRVYLVGGCVRDILLGKEPKDLDFEIFDIDEKNFKIIMQKIGAKGVGESFFVYKYKNVDLSLPRIEKKVAKGHRGFEVKVAFDIKEASKRRDFTINALMINIYDYQLKDFWGGVEDLKKKLIRIIDEESFKEDSLRVLRGMQFASRLKFKIEKRSLSIMQNISLDDLTKERIFIEFEKMFHSSYLHYGLYYLFKLKIAKKLLNLEIDCQKFIKTALELQRNRERFLKEFYPLYFIYILSKNLNINFEYIPTLLKAPNFYKRVLKKQIIREKPTIKEIYFISTNYPIKEWLGNYQKDVIEIAKRYDIFEKRFNKIRAIDVIRDGFKKEEISKEIKRREKEFIEKLF